FATKIAEALSRTGICATIANGLTYPTLGACGNALRSCEAVVTMRFHGAVLAMIYDVPVFALGCSPKITDLFVAGGLEQRVVPMTAVTSDAVAISLCNLIGDRLSAINDQRRARDLILASPKSRTDLIAAVRQTANSRINRRIGGAVVLVTAGFILVIQCVLTGLRKGVQAI